MPYTTIIFDLDETMYSPSVGIWDKLSERIHQYMEEETHIPKELVKETRTHYYTTYGTTMRGLVKHHSIDPVHYLDYVHDFQIDGEIYFDPQLIEMIAGLPYERYIFTNATRQHAQRILKILGIDQYFLKIVDIMDVYPYCKPMREAFDIALDHLEKIPEECLFIDDSEKNLATANDMGFYTILPNAEVTQIAQPHVLLKDLIDLPKVLPFQK